MKKRGKGNFGQVWASYGYFGQVQASLGKFGQVRTSQDKLGQVRTRQMEKKRQKGNKNFSGQGGGGEEGGETKVQNSPKAFGELIISVHQTIRAKNLNT